MADCIYLRDQIRIDTALSAEIAAEIAAGHLTPDGTILLAAREIVHEPGYRLTLPSHRVVVAADTYRCDGGSIDVSGVAGLPGAVGADGADGFASRQGRDNKPGEPGGGGGAGGSGQPAGQITLIARTLDTARLLAVGGAGGPGGPGGRGGAGGNGLRGTVRNPGFPGTDGGNGGPGGNGGNGGAGGEVQLVFAERTGPDPTLDGSGGGGGNGGSGGSGGSRGQTELGDLTRDGSPGRPGANGMAGSSASPQVEQFDGEQWWSKTQALLGTNATAWARYRCQVAEYQWRTYRPSDPAVPSLLSQALDNYRAAVLLGEVSASDLAEQVAARLTPAGVPADVDLIPDFRRYEQVVVDYATLVSGCFGVASTLLANASAVEANRAQLIQQAERIRRSSLDLTLEVDAAELALERAAATRDASDKRLAENQQALEANRAQLEAEQLELDGNILGTVFAVAGALTALIPGVGAAFAAVAAVPGLLVKAQQAVGDEVTYDKATRTFTSRGRYLVDLIDRSDPKNPTFRPELVALGKGLKEVWDKTATVVSQVKLLDDIGRAKPSSGQAQRTELLAERAELVFERAQADLQVRQAELLLAAAVARRDAAVKDAAAIDAQAAVLAADVRGLGKTVRTLVHQAQAGGDVVVKYCFLAARALELWTLQTQTSDFDFSVGHIAPDDAANAYLALDRGDGSRAKDLLGDYITSWGRLPAFATLRDGYETYTSQLVDNLLFVHVSDPEILRALAEGRTARVTIALSVLPADRPEAKLDRVFVSLPGAQSADPRVTVLVEHDGDSLVRRADGSTVRVVLPPRRLPVSAGLSADDLGGLQGELRQPLWGRSPAASWRFTVEPGAGGADLSGLSEALIALSYQSLLV